MNFYSIVYEKKNVFSNDICFMGLNNRKYLLLFVKKCKINGYHAIFNFIHFYLSHTYNKK